MLPPELAQREQADVRALLGVVVVQHRDVERALVERGLQPEDVVIQAERHVPELLWWDTHAEPDVDEPRRDADLRNARAVEVHLPLERQHAEALRPR